MPLVAPERQISHGTVSVERLLPATPQQVFAAWADPQARLCWDLPDKDWPVQYEHFDFRVGGRDVLRFTAPGGAQYTAEHCYHDIVPDRRIVASRVTSRLPVRDTVRPGDKAAAGGEPIFIGLVTAEFHPASEGCRLVVTEQGVRLAGEDDGLALRPA
ncbi:MAG: SRPBCC domain-containing protein [Moraxellaceae bacterium]|nr:SRPBCC domain-containing protein [Moraxellaceae bacterium]